MKPLNQFITEDILGKCYHEWEWYITSERMRRKKCKKCPETVSSGNQRSKMTDYTSPEGWWELWKFIRSDPFLWKKLKYDYQWEEWEWLTLQQRAEYIAKFKGWKENDTKVR